MKHIALMLSATLLLWVTNIYGASEDVSRQAVAIPEVYIASDSEGFNTYKYRAGYYPFYEHAEKYTGVEYQNNYFTQNGWSSSANQLSLLTSSINPRSALGYKMSIGYNEGSGHSLVTLDGQYGTSLYDTTKLELVLNRDRVETQNAINNGVSFTLLGLSVDQQLIKRLSLVLMGGEMFFSDSNTRPFVKLRLIYDLIPDYGVTAQLRYREFHSTDIDVPNNYFNPENYSETMLAIGWRQRVKGWVLNGTVGIGQQQVNQDEHTMTELLEFAATSPVADKTFFKTRVGYSKSAGANGPDYTYQYLMEELIFSF